MSAPETYMGIPVPEDLRSGWIWERSTAASSWRQGVRDTLEGVKADGYRDTDGWGPMDCPYDCDSCHDWTTCGCPNCKGQREEHDED